MPEEELPTTWAAWVSPSDPRWPWQEQPNKCHQALRLAPDLAPVGPQSDHNDANSHPGNTNSLPGQRQFHQFLTLRFSSDLKIFLSQSFFFKLMGSSPGLGKVSP